MGVELIVLRHHPVLDFAREEWTSLNSSLLHGERETSPKQVVIGTWNDVQNGKPELLQTSEVQRMNRAQYSDEFMLIEREAIVVLSGRNERATLYAVYEYAKLAWGMHWIYPGEATKSDTAKTTSDTANRNRKAIPPVTFFAPYLERRGFVFETINEPEYLLRMIDWMSKNKANEIFFTFMLWDQVGQQLAPEIAKRGIDVTLGGHSMAFFLESMAKEDAKTSAETEPNHPYTAKRQLDYGDESWQAPVFSRLIDYGRSVPNLARISLWPEDIAAQKGQGCDGEPFLSQYIRFTERLKASFDEAGIAVDVEHIAYNAGLAWDMLDRGPTSASRSIDTLFAYWGRDYRYGYDASPHASDSRAKAILTDWEQAVKAAGKQLTIFEYYSDHYMLSPLFPSIPTRIMEDIRTYRELDLHGIVNLVVPYKGEADYPWKWAHGMNSYVFCRALWAGEPHEILDDFYRYFSPDQREGAKRFLEASETTMTALTEWNVPLFPTRAVDAEQVLQRADTERVERICKQLHEIEQRMNDVIRSGSLPEESEAYRCAAHYAAYANALRAKYRAKPRAR